MIAVGPYTAAIVSQGIFLFVAFSTVPHSAANIGSILAFFLIKMFQLLLYTALYNCVVNVFYYFISDISESRWFAKKNSNGWLVGRWKSAEYLLDYGRK